jgi:hypothetical protein
MDYGFWTDPQGMLVERSCQGTAVLSTEHVPNRVHPHLSCRALSLPFMWARGIVVEDGSGPLPVSISNSRLAPTPPAPTSLGNPGPSSYRPCWTNRSMQYPRSVRTLLGREGPRDGLLTSESSRILDHRSPLRVFFPAC